MKVFIVHAHPESKSFNGALTRRAVEVLEAVGHEVRISDLYAMGFNPISGRHNFTSAKDPEVFCQNAEEAHASEVDGFAPDIKAEMEKVAWCDAMIFQFPMWWFSMPAMLKGWVDRVIAAGKMYSAANRWYDNGLFKGRRAMLSVTVGGPPSIYSPRGLNGDIETLLYPINHGILRFIGFDVLPPFIAYAPGFVGDDVRAHYLDAYAQKLRELETTAPIEYPLLSAYDETFQLKG